MSWNNKEEMYNLFWMITRRLVPKFRKFLNVGTYNSDVGESPQIKNITKGFLNHAYFAKGN
jgi:hypothetical protein